MIEILCNTGIIIGIVGILLVFTIAICYYFYIKKEYENGKYRTYSQQGLPNEEDISLDDAMKYLKLVNLK